MQSPSHSPASVYIHYGYYNLEISVQASFYMLIFSYFNGANMILPLGNIPDSPFT